MSQYKVGDRIIMHKPGYGMGGPSLTVGTIVKDVRSICNTGMYAVQFDEDTYDDERDFHVIQENRFRKLTKLDKALK
jgi:hypothetical protein